MKLFKIIKNKNRKYLRQRGIHTTGLDDVLIFKCVQLTLPFTI